MKLLIGILVGICLIMVGVGYGTSTSTSTSSNPKRPVALNSTITLEIPGQGLILGNYATTAWTNQTIMQFRGIPYAESPRGKLRFKPPVARLPWRQIADATKFGKRCPEYNTYDANASDPEDCLNLCVYTKDLSARRPVMFHLYGGGFYNGSNDEFPPRYLLEKDLVLVVPNWRIGALGWASTLSMEMPGNLPVMDLQLALRWVQRNIEHFGGDPSQVTMSGQSAGAATTGAIMLSPKTEPGLVHRFILQSGSILGSYALSRDPIEQVSRICLALKCPASECNAGPSERYECLRRADVRRLLEVTRDESFAPVVGDPHGVLPLHPSDLLASYKQNLSVMTGFTKHDGSYWVSAYYDKVKAVYGDNLGRQMTVRQFARGLIEALGDTSGTTGSLLMRLLFTPSLLDSHDHKTAVAAYFDLTSVPIMKSPVIELASRLIAKRLMPVYVYSFDYIGEHSRFGYEETTEHYPFNGGAHHSDENLYLFDQRELNIDDTGVAKQMVDLWSSFVIDGEPKLFGEGVTMPAMKTESGPYFSIHHNVTIKDDVLTELSAAVDDPNSRKELVREDKEF